MKRRKRAFYENRSLLAGLLIVIIAVAALDGILVYRIFMGGKAGASDSTAVTTVSSVQTASVDSVSEVSEISSVSEESTEQSSEVQEEPVDTEAATVISPDSIASLYGYMTCISDGTTVLNKGADDRIYPASMTKVMTVLVALEHLPDLDEQITLDPNVIDPLYEVGASMAGFSGGETVTVRELLYGAILPSGADACKTLAIRVAGSEEAFADLMNQKAADLGMTGTHFTNSTGLHDEAHYTTCRDMATLFTNALQDGDFYVIITTQEYRCNPNEYHEEGLYFASTMFSLMDHTVMDNGAQILGGKTGTTDEAGYCLVSFGTYNDKTYVLVTALGQYNDEEIHYNITDAYTAYSSLS